jgi:hypothetical protein
MGGGIYWFDKEENLLLNLFLRKIKLDFSSVPPIANT